MELRTIIISIVTTIVVLVFIVFGLRACTRDSAPSASAAGGGAVGSFDPNRNLTACTADPETGLCYPEEDNPELPFDWENFMATVRAHQKSSSASSSRGAFFGGSSILDRIRGGASSSVSHLRTRSSFSESSSVSDDNLGWLDDF